MGRRSNQENRDERGIALVMTLLVVALLSILVVEFTHSIQVESHISRNSLNGLQANYLARSGINIVSGALLIDNSRTVDPDEEDRNGWGSFALEGCTSLPSLQLPPNWDVCVRLVDESGKINLNWTKPSPSGGQSQQPQECSGSAASIPYCWRDALRRLFSARGIDESVVDEIGDYWVTNVPKPRPGQAAQVLAPEFSSLEDAAAAFPALRAEGAFDAIRDVVTALPAGTRSRQLNANTASREVIAAVANDDAAAQRIIEAREEKPLSGNVTTLLEGISNAPVVARQFTYASSYFRIEASARVNGIGKTIRALVRRDPAAARSGAPAGTQAWSLTFLDWQKEGGARLFESTARAVLEDLEGARNSANN